MTGRTHTWRIVEGDCGEVLRSIEEASIDAVVTDPPYGLSFMGSAWDTFDPRTLDQRVGRRDGNGPPSDVRDGRSKGRTKSAFANGAGEAGAYDFSAGGNRAFQEWCETWAREALRVLKPGGHLLAFGGTRTYHRLVVGVEDAGFAVRDQLAWLFGSGFPKSRDLGDGRGTALKPGHEPIVLARKPLSGTAAANVAEHGTGGLNIDACRIDVVDVDYTRNHSGDRGHAGTRSIDQRGATDLRMGGGQAARGRWPANVILDEAAADQLDEQTGTLRSGANPTRRGSDKFRDVYGDFAGQEQCTPARGADEGGASRFFYVAKPDGAERHAGLGAAAGLFAPTEVPDRNDHPTVKPIDAMRWLVRLVTPAGGTVLDPFTGSGTTGIAALLEGRSFLGVEREPAFAAIARARLSHWSPGAREADDVVRIGAAAEGSS